VGGFEVYVAVVWVRVRCDGISRIFYCKLLQRFSPNISAHLTEGRRRDFLHRHPKKGKRGLSSTIWSSNPLNKIQKARKNSTSTGKKAGKISTSFSVRRVEELLSSLL
jgi:hypothetical protein